VVLSAPGELGRRNRRRVGLREGMNHSVSRREDFLPLNHVMSPPVWSGGPAAQRNRTGFSRLLIGA